MITCFFGITGHVAIVPLDQRRTESEWYTNIFVRSAWWNKKQEAATKDHFSSWQCKLSEIGWNKYLFEWTRRLINGSASIEFWFSPKWRSPMLGNLVQEHAKMFCLSWRIRRKPISEFSIMTYGHFVIRRSKYRWQLYIMLLKLQTNLK